MAHSVKGDCSSSQTLGQVLHQVAQSAQSQFQCGHLLKTLLTVSTKLQLEKGSDLNPICMQSVCLLLRMSWKQSVTILFNQINSILLTGNASEYEKIQKSETCSPTHVLTENTEHNPKKSRILTSNDLTF